MNEKLFEKVKGKILLWAFLTGCAIITGAAVVVLSLSLPRSDVGATVTVPDIKIYIKGEIKSPGLYKVGADTRLIELVEIAGGFTDNADEDSLNFAEILVDGTTVVIPGPDSADKVETDVSKSQSKSSREKSESAPGKTKKISSGTVNINIAGEEELMSIPGIGQVTAKKIVDYREENGSFLSLEEIMNVSGIGEKTFEKIKNYITIE